MRGEKEVIPNGIILNCKITILTFDVPYSETFSVLYLYLYRNIFQKCSNVKFEWGASPDDAWLSVREVLSGLLQVTPGTFVLE